MGHWGLGRSWHCPPLQRREPLGSRGIPHSRGTHVSGACSAPAAGRPTPRSPCAPILPAAEVTVAWAVGQRATHCPTVPGTGRPRLRRGPGAHPFPRAVASTRRVLPRAPGGQWGQHLESRLLPVRTRIRAFLGPGPTPVTSVGSGSSLKAPSPNAVASAQGFDGWIWGMVQSVTSVHPPGTARCRPGSPRTLPPECESQGR